MRFRSTGLTAGRWRDYAGGSRLKTMALAAVAFLPRFLLHVLPGGFVRIYHCGILANRGRAAKLARPAVSPVERCRALLAAVAPEAPAAPEPFD